MSVDFKKQSCLLMLLLWKFTVLDSLNWINIIHSNSLKLYKPIFSINLIRYSCESIKKLRYLYIIFQRNWINFIFYSKNTKYESLRRWLPSESVLTIYTVRFILECVNIWKDIDNEKKIFQGKHIMLIFI